MGYCYCTGRVSTPKVKTCSDCLVANQIIVGCGQGLLPCGGTTTINLQTYNNNPSDAVYSLISGGYSIGDFAAASVTAAGILSITTGVNYTPHGLKEIKYMVSREDGKYKDFESIWICFDNPCDAGCTNCNTCEGTCYGTPAEASVTVSCEDIGLTHNAATGLNIASCDGTNTWTVTAPAALTASISNVGLITYDINGIALPGQTYRITWKLVCSLYGMETTGFLDVYVEDKCIGVTCEDPNQECEQCTGNCVDKESDMAVNGATISSSGPTVSTT